MYTKPEYKEIPEIKIIAEGIGGNTKIFLNGEEISAAVEDFHIKHAEFPGLMAISLELLVTGEIIGLKQNSGVWLDVCNNLHELPDERKKRMEAEHVIKNQLNL